MYYSVYTTLIISICVSTYLFTCLIIYLTHLLRLTSTEERENSVKVVNLECACGEGGGGVEGGLGTVGGVGHDPVEKVLNDASFT